MSVADMTAPVVGSSGGVYALVSAHLANIVMVSASCPSMPFLASPLPSLGLHVNRLELGLGSSSTLQPRPSKHQADLVGSRIHRHYSPSVGPLQMGWGPSICDSYFLQSWLCL